MLEPRLYRAAFVPFLLAIFVVAFSLSGRVRPLQTTFAPEAFDGARAMQRLADLQHAYPDRRPGSAGDNALADEMARAFANAGFAVRRHRFDAPSTAGRRELQTIVAVRPGTSSRALVLVAHRDAARPGSAAELSGTAALLELTRVLSGRVTSRSIVLASTSGGSGGAAGAADLVHLLPRPLDAVIVLGDLAGTRSRRSYVVPWSDRGGVAPIRLRRTVEATLQSELGRSAGGTATSDQLARLAFPITVGEQGPLDGAGVPAVLVQESGELGPTARDPVSAAQMEVFGRGVLRALSALDSGPDVEAAPTRDVLIGSRVLHSWSVSLLVATLLLPALLAAIDVLARMRRRGAPVARHFAWLALTAAPFALALLFARALGLTGLLRAAPSGPVTPRLLAVDTGGRVAMVSVALVALVAWGLPRRVALRRLGLTDAAAAQGAVAALLLGTCVLALAIWLRNPYAAGLLLAPAHLWLLALTPEPPRDRRALLALWAVSLVPVAGLLALFAARLRLGPEGIAWTSFLLGAGGHLDLPAVGALSSAAGLTLAALSIVWRRGRTLDPEAPPITVRGPASYAGPGSLGGTESALPR